MAHLIEDTDLYGEIRGMLSKICGILMSLITCINTSTM